MESKNYKKQKEMVNYKEGKIYKIISPTINKIYIGSTCLKYLSKRMGQHKSAFNHPEKNFKCSSWDMFKNNDAKIILLEKFPCDSRDELNAREQHWIDSVEYKGKTVNKFDAKLDRKKTLHCECGGSFTVSHRSRHLKESKVHKAYLDFANN